MPTPTITIGTRVKYHRDWLRNTGQYTGDDIRRRGTVKSIDPLREGRSICLVEWDDGTESKLLNANLYPANMPDPCD